MRAAAAISHHPVGPTAVGEVVGELLEAVGPGPDAVLVAVTPPFAGIFDEVVRTVEALLQPQALVGAAVPGLLAASQVVEGDAAVAALALARTSDGGAATTVRLPADDPVGAWSQVADGSDLEGATLVLLADDRMPSTADLLAHIGRVAPGCTILGGTLAATHGAPMALATQEGRWSDGAVGLLLHPQAPVQVATSLGSRAIGLPHVVTTSSGAMVVELDGRPALDVVRATALDVAPEDRRRMAEGMRLAVEADPPGAGAPVPGDPVVHAVLGADRSTGAVALSGVVETGSRVRLHVRDHETTEEELRVALGHRIASAALVFAPEGGPRPDGVGPRPDAEIVHEQVDRGAVAGIVCAHQLAPVGGTTRILDGATAVALLGTGQRNG